MTDANAVAPVVRLDPEARRSMRRVAVAALAGTSIEWYDFFLYGTAAALVFPTVFFSADTPLWIAQILSYLTFAAGFVARPLGGVAFGHFGDRIGRKKTLVVALMIMGIASTLIGLLPGYATIGPAAPVGLVALRFVQGLAIGGQWGGAMLLVTENAPPTQRGYWGAYAQAGALVGLILANVGFWLTDSLVGDAAFGAWGWRVPFVASIALIGVSMYIQLRLEDTAAFRALEQRKSGQASSTARPGTSSESGVAETPARSASPVIDALRLYPGRILLAAGAFVSIQVSFYIMIVFAVAYGTALDGPALSRDTMLAAVVIASAVSTPVLFWAAAFSDRRGRRGIYLTGAALAAVWAFALFPLIDSGAFPLVTLGLVGGFIFLVMQYGPQAAFFAELFSTQVRYSGASLGYQLGAILGGALAPTFAALLLREFGTIGVSGYIAGASLVTVVSVLVLTETKGVDMHGPHAELP